MLSSSPAEGSVMRMAGARGSPALRPRSRTNSVDMESCLLEPTTLLEVASMSGDEGVNLHATACSVFNFLMPSESSAE